MVVFICNSVLLAVGLAMDAFSVSLANGMQAAGQSKRMPLAIALTFGVFQGIMPMTGWLCVHTAASYFEAFSACVPWIAMVLLAFIGGKMLLEGIKNYKTEEPAAVRLTFGSLLVQGVATSIDALSVGFTIEEYSAPYALLCALIIAAVTFVICLAGVYIGKRFGTKFSKYAAILGGVILIGIGVEILLSCLLG